jgi:transcriptional regulator
MKKLTQLQYEVIFLYSKGLTFREIDSLLKTASKGIYTQVIAKDKGRVTRAKKSRKINLNIYKQELSNYIDEVKANNKRYRNSIQWIKEKYIITESTVKVKFRQRYMLDSLNKSYKSYSKYKITFLKKVTGNVA